MNQRGMGADLQPEVHAKFGEGVDGGGKQHRLPHPSSPVEGVAGFAGTTPAGDGAEKWDRPGLRNEIGEGLLEFLRGRLHERMMKGMIDADEPSEDALRLELSKHGFERKASP